MDSYAVAVTILSVIAGAVSVLVASFGFVGRYRESTANLKRAREAELQVAVASSDLRTLGEYLYERVGSFSVHDYVYNSEARNRVTTLVKGIKDYVGEPEPVEPLSKELPPAPPAVDLEPSPLATEFHQAELEIRKGNTWNGLARLRRALDINFRAMAEMRELQFELERAGTKRLLDLLVAEGEIPDRAARRLGYAIAVANRAVHGLDVTRDQAKEALLEAALGIRIIEEERG